MSKISGYAALLTLVVSIALLSGIGAALTSGETEVGGTIATVLAIVPPEHVDIPLVPGGANEAFGNAEVEANVEWCIYAEDNSIWPDPLTANGHMKSGEHTVPPAPHEFTPNGGELETAIDVDFDGVWIPLEGGAKTLVTCSDVLGETTHVTSYHQTVTYTDEPSEYEIIITWYIEAST